MKKLAIALAGVVVSGSSLKLEPVYAHGFIMTPHSHSDLSSTQASQDYLVVQPGAPGREAYYEASSGLDKPFNLYTFLAKSDETGGAFSLFNFEISPGGGTPLHTHRNDAEALYILDGELTVYLADQTQTVSAGSFVYLPVGKPHGFGNLSTNTVNALSLTTPSGLDKFFEEAGVLSTGNGPPPASAFDFSNILEVLARYGLEPGTTTLPEPLLDFVVVPPDAGGRPTFDGPFGGQYTSLATQEETGGEFSYSIFSLPTQSGLPQLTQSSAGESFYVLDGDLTLQLGNQTTVAAPGTYVYIPAGKPYSVANLGTNQVKALSISVAAVPEPASWLGLLGVGAYVGSGLVRKRKQKNSHC